LTYPELLTSLYKEHAPLLSLWRQSVERSGERGVFAFLPDSYLPSATLNEVRFEFWPGSRLEAYLHRHGSPDDGYRELGDQIDETSEFLVFIIEPADADGRRPVHVHRIGPLGHN